MEQYKKYNDKGLTGLGNLGNTCYINSFIQILSHTYELNDFMSSKEFRQRLNPKECTLLIEWNKLRKLMWSENCTVAPWGFFKTIQSIAETKDRELFTGYMQNDLPEFILFILDCFHLGLQREVEMKITGKIQTSSDKLAKDCYNMMCQMYRKEYSEILNLFYCITVTQIIDKNDKILINKPEPCSLISIPIKNTETTLYECFDSYCDLETMEGENAWFNEETNKKENVSKRTMFWSLPNILIIDLKRFNNNNSKINSLVTFPIDELDLSKYIIGYNPKQYNYELYGIGNHSGNSMGGHYYAYVKNSNGKWYSYNDTIVKEISINELVTTKTYCLFYRKK